MPLQIVLILSSCWSHKRSLPKECPTPNFCIYLSRVPPKRPDHYTLYYRHQMYCINYTLRRSTVRTPGDHINHTFLLCINTNYRLSLAFLGTNTLPKTSFPITCQQCRFFKARNNFHRYAKQPEKFLYVKKYIHTYIRTYVCMYVCVYICMYVCMYVRVVLGEHREKLIIV